MSLPPCQSYLLHFPSTSPSQFYDIGALSLLHSILAESPLLSAFPLLFFFLDSCPQSPIPWKRSQAFRSSLPIHDSSSCTLCIGSAGRPVPIQEEHSLGNHVKILQSVEMFPKFFHLILLSTAHGASLANYCHSLLKSIFNTDHIGLVACFISSSKKRSPKSNSLISNPSMTSTCYSPRVISTTDSFFSLSILTEQPLSPSPVCVIL